MAEIDDAGAEGRAGADAGGGKSDGKAGGAKPAKAEPEAPAAPAAAPVAAAAKHDTNGTTADGSWVATAGLRAPPSARRMMAESGLSPADVHGSAPWRPHHRQ